MLQATAVILSGGRNRRMGQNKAFLEIGETKIIDRIVREMGAHFAEVLVVSNEPAKYDYLKLKIVTDQITGMGPLSGMHAGLKASKHHFSLVLACDMPFAEGILGEMLVQEAPGFDVVVPQVGEYLQPLFAVYSKNCIAPIENCLQNGISKVYSFYPRVRVKYIPQDKIAKVADLNRIFINVNTPEELENARSLKLKDNLGGKQYERKDSH